MSLVWLDFFKTANDPQSATPQDRRRFGRMATGITVFGALYLMGAAAAAVFWALELRAFGPAPRTTIAVQDFSTNDLQGPLQEARLSGFLQLDQMRAVAPETGNLRTLIPLTTHDWTSGDPVSVFVETHLFIYDQQLQTSGEQFERGLQRFDLPTQTSGPARVSVLVKTPARTSPLDAGQDATIVEFVQPEWRDAYIAREVSGLKLLAQLFGVMGAAIAATGYFSRRAIKRVSD